MKHLLGVDVLSAAEHRISYIFDHFSRIFVSFSGGKDSTVLLHLVMDEAKRRNRKVGLLFIDWEAQYKKTISFIEQCFETYKDHIEPYWVALPLRTTNACSMIEPEWICWDPAKEPAWVRPMPKQAITSLPFYQPNMTFEEFVPAFGAWYAQSEPAIGFVGLRTSESLNRWRAIAGEKATFEGKFWTTNYGEGSYSAYPIYDWTVEDVWTYFAKFGKEYNPIYDLMHKAGLSPSQMRICEPYGDEQRRGLWLYQILEPETWGAVAARVEGANSASLYVKESGNILGNRQISKPFGHSWESFVKFLLSTMPTKTAEHYKDKFSVWRRWYEVRGVSIVDELPDDTGSEDKPTWRRLCKVLLRNDYWCRTLSFSPTKTAAYEAYREMMKKRRKAWSMEEW